MNNPFRVVYSNVTQENQNFSHLADMLSWRIYQTNHTLGQNDFWVIKMGHKNTLLNIDFKLLEQALLSCHANVKALPVRFSLYLDVFNINSCDKNIREALINYQEFSEKMKIVWPGFHCHTAWVWDNEHNTVDDVLAVLNQKHELNISSLHYNLYIHHINQNYLKAIDMLSFCHERFDGLDCTGFINHFDNGETIGSHSMRAFLDNLKTYHTDILERICPEFMSFNALSENNIKHDIAQFCLNGCVINMDNLSINPLIYGSFDDFTLTDKKPLIFVDEWLLKTYADINQLYQTHWLKKVIKSHCFSCEYFTACQSKKYYWSNLPNDFCELSIDTLWQEKI